MPKDMVQITPEILIQDNRSPRSRELMTVWEEAKRMRNLLIVHDCGDARVSSADVLGRVGLVALNSIASANTREDISEDPFAFVYPHYAAKAVLINGHYDGDTVINGEPPKGCGGLGERAKITPEKNELGTIETAAQYVAELIEHSDVVIQTLVSAARVAKMTDAPIYAALVDHLANRWSPIAIINSGTITTPIPLSALFAYDPKQIYRDGMPEMQIQDDRSLLSDLVHENQIQMAQTLKRDPEFRKHQKVQDPHTILFSTDVRSPRIRYPSLSGPNTMFRVRVPYEKVAGKMVGISPQHLESSFAQSQYPISHTIGSIPGKPFYSTRNFIIETPDMDLSREVAGKLVKKDWMQPWINQEGGKILVAQVVHAETTHAETMKI